jgi:hypothetical protein
MIRISGFLSLLYLNNEKMFGRHGGAFCALPRHMYSLPFYNTPIIQENGDFVKTVLEKSALFGGDFVHFSWKVQKGMDGYLDNPQAP